MAVVAERLARPDALADADRFVADADLAAARYGGAWRPARVVERGRLFLVDDTGQSIGAFKLRGATVAVGEIARRGVERVCVASSGSFGMAVATAARARALAASVFMPAETPAGKQEAIAALGAEVDARWPTYEAGKAEARRAGETAGSVFVDGVGWEVFGGNASLVRELTAAGRVTRQGAVMVVPLGIGSLAVPTALYLAGSGYASDLVVVEPLSHCKYTAALGGAAAPAGGPTLADGAAVREVPELSRRLLDRVTTAAVAVSEPEIEAAIRELWREHGVRSEGAGALALAAYRSVPQLFDRYTQVWAFVTGRNIDERRLAEIVG